jgi:hypothetical protein
MILVWVSVGIVVIATVLAIFWTVSIRKRRLLSSLQIEIENQGNVDSRYQLLAEDPLGGLTFKFFYNGEPLQTIVKSDGKTVAPVQASRPPAPKRSGSKSESVDNAIGFTGALANVMIGLGSLLGGAGKPLVAAGNKLFQGQVNAAKARTVSRQAAALGTGTDRSQYSHSTQPDTVGQAPLNGIVWAETAAVKPGTKLLVDLKVQAAYFKNDMTRAFTVKSYPSEGANTSEVVAEGAVRIRGGFLSHKFYPPLVIIGTSTLLLAVIYWLVRIGVLY